MFSKIEEKLKENRIRFVKFTSKGRKVLTDITPYGTCDNNELKKYVMFRKAKDIISDIVKDTGFKLRVDGWDDGVRHCHWLTIAR